MASPIRPDIRCWCWCWCQHQHQVATETGRSTVILTCLGALHDAVQFFFEADAWKMDYGGHDSAIVGNVIYHGDGADHDGGDGQNCLNTWPFLPGHGAVYNHNKCILPRSNNLFGSLAGCDCPGTNPVTPWHSPADKDPNGQCGVTFDANQYFTHNGSAHALRCGDFETSWKGKNEPDSTISTLPSDEQLMLWAKEVLLMK